MERPGRSLDPSTQTQVRVGSELSSVIKLKRSVCQGSVLSPLLFLLVMPQAGVLIRTRSLCHTDDLRSVTLSLLSLEKHVVIILAFTSANSLTSNLDKLDLLAMCGDEKPPECALSVQQSTNHLLQQQPVLVFMVSQSITQGRHWE